MALTGSTNAEKIWNYLYAKIGNAYGVAGLMGNLYAESGLKPKNLQNSYESKLGYTDDTYTTAVDNKTYTKFASDSAGYGLAQWTYSTRKKNMLAYHQSKGKSIGDLETQLAFLVKELSESYTTVWSALKNATSIETASTTVLKKYENPADQSTTVQKKRASYGQEYYDKYANTSSTTTKTTSTTSSTTSTSGVTAGRKLSLSKCPLYASSTATTKANTITGTYYLWDTTKTNGRYRITNSTANVGKSGKITGWIDASYVSGTSSTSTTSTSSIKAGKKLTLSKCPLYTSSTATTKANTITGTYYLWDATAKNGRYRITNSTANVGKTGKITGWISKSYVS